MPSLFFLASVSSNALDQQEAINNYLKGRNLQPLEGIWIDNNNEIFLIYQSNDNKYYHTFEKSYSSNLETQAPLYHQILQQEQIELHKLGQLIKAHDGVILDYNTDAINAIIDSYSMMYNSLMAEIPSYALKQDYRERMKKSYPFHPELIDVAKKIHKLEKTLSASSSESELKRLSKLQDEFLALDGYNYESEVKMVLKKMALLLMEKEEFRRCAKSLNQLKAQNQMVKLLLKL